MARRLFNVADLFTISGRDSYAILISLTVTVLAYGDATTRPSATQPTSLPAPADVLSGTYKGLVMHHKKAVPVVTNFKRDADGSVVGTYIIRDGGKDVAGKLDRFEVVWPEMMWCTMRWQDEFGAGPFSFWVFPDGSAFEGFWGREFAHPDLKWNGKRVPELPATRPAH